MKRFLAFFKKGLRKTPTWSRKVHEDSINSPQARKQDAGQNLVELALTLPMVLVMLFAIVELGRVWMTYESAKTAAREGAYVASIYHNPQAGQDQMNYKLSAAGVTVKSATVAQVPGQHAYESDVTVTFEPFFGNIQIPTLGGPISIFPAQFDMGYKAITDVSVY